MNLFFPIHQALSASPFGAVNPPGRFTPGLSGLGALIGSFINIAVGFAGILAMFQLIAAGYMYLNAQGDPKKAEMAWWRIMYSLIGLLVVVAALLAPDIIQALTGQNPTQLEIN